MPTFSIFDDTQRNKVKHEKHFNFFHELINRLTVQQLRTRTKSSVGMAHLNLFRLGHFTLNRVNVKSLVELSDVHQISIVCAYTTVD